MGAFFSATLLIFRMHLVRVVRSRRAVLCALVSAIPPAFAWLIWQLDDDVPAGQ